ncbi:hypothetical protein BDV28DRAFT_136728 [Aspergillus coremiiformis]|uniref:Uncharacterized protein n=1 Tax=Aspergillus coremiiformis TaxID=138285 RepID=A0A5N6Z1T6_9EURO|nr:hypothetical protein BDV28DRAFT_136728 [Aspergillus coremiiformis]
MNVQVSLFSIVGGIPGAACGARLSTKSTRSREPPMLSRAGFLPSNVDRENRPCRAYHRDSSICGTPWYTLDGRSKHHMTRFLERVDNRGIHVP